MFLLPKILKESLVNSNRSTFISRYALRLLCTSSTPANTSSSGSDLPAELDKLKPLESIHLNQVPKCLKRRGLQTDQMGGANTVEIEAVSDEKDLLFRIEFSRGHLPQELIIKIYGLGEDKPLLAEMNLERSLQLRAFILRVKSPPGNLIGSIYELAGITQVAIVEDEKSYPVLQVITNGGFGWATAALILSGTGDERLGLMTKIKQETRGNDLFTKITFPSSLKISTKLTLVGACLTFMGRYHL